MSSHLNQSSTPTPNQKVFIITGASDGIGAEMARQLASRYGAGIGGIGLVLAARAGRNADVAHRFTVAHVADLRIAATVAEDDYFVD